MKRKCIFRASFGHKKRPAEAGEHRSLDLQIYAQSIAQIKKDRHPFGQRSKTNGELRGFTFLSII